MTYLRVIPRDLFNEANLLKCWGKLWILTEGRREVEIEHDHEPFNTEQDESDGSIHLTNVKLLIHGVEQAVTRPLNNRDPWPLELHTGDTTIRVFTNTGELSEDFLALLGA